MSGPRGAFGGTRSADSSGRERRIVQVPATSELRSLDECRRYSSASQSAGSRRLAASLGRRRARRRGTPAGARSWSRDDDEVARRRARRRRLGVRRRPAGGAQRDGQPRRREVCWRGATCRPSRCRARRLARVHGGARGVGPRPALARPGRRVRETLPDLVLRELVWERDHPAARAARWSWPTTAPPGWGCAPRPTAPRARGRARPARPGGGARPAGRACSTWAAGRRGRTATTGTPSTTRPGSTRSAAPTRPCAWRAAEAGDGRRRPLGPGRLPGRRQPAGPRGPHRRAPRGGGRRSAAVPRTRRVPGSGHPGGRNPTWRAACIGSSTSSAPSETSWEDATAARWRRPAARFATCAWPR